MAERTCTEVACDGPTLARGLCHKHYARWSRTGTTALLVRAKVEPAPREQCSAPECFNLVKALGICGMHYQRTLRFGSIDIPPRIPPSAIVCRSCRTSQPAKNFPPYRRVCRACKAAHIAAWRADNRDELRGKSAARWLANHDRNIEYQRAYQIANREILKVKARRRGAASKRLRCADSNFTQAGLAARVDYYGGMCWICRVAPYEHLDHVKPLSKGGPNLLSNIRPACAACNLAKSAKWPFALAGLAA